MTFLKQEIMSRLINVLFSSFGWRLTKRNSWTGKHRTHGERQKLLLRKNTQNQKTKRQDSKKKSFFQKSFVDNFTNEWKHYCVFWKLRYSSSGSVLLVIAGYSLSPVIKKKYSHLPNISLLPKLPLQLVAS